LWPRAARRARTPHSRSDKRTTRPTGRTGQGGVHPRPFTPGAHMADCACPAESAGPLVVAYRWQTPAEGHRPTGAAPGFGGAR
jgi:hypothetical protein